jgi:hypothetical protein
MIQSCGVEEEGGQEEQGILCHLCGKVNPSLPCLLTSVDLWADLVTVWMNGLCYGWYDHFQGRNSVALPTNAPLFLAYVGI